MRRLQFIPPPQNSESEAFSRLMREQNSPIRIIVEPLIRSVQELQDNYMANVAEMRQILAENQEELRKAWEFVGDIVSENPELLSNVVNAMRIEGRLKVMRGLDDKLKSRNVYMQMLEKNGYLPVYCVRDSSGQIKGGQAKSERKTAANRLKARLGGRPRKDGTPARPRVKPEETAGIPTGQGVKPEEFEVGNS